MVHRFFIVVFGILVLASSPPAHAQAVHRPARDSTGRIVAVYAIQVGAFAVKENAVRLQREFKKKGFKAVIYDNLLDGKNLLYLVWVGRFDTPEEAMPMMKKIEAFTGIRGVLREQMIWRKW